MVVLRVVWRFFCCFMMILFGFMVISWWFYGVLWRCYSVLWWFHCHFMGVDGGWCALVQSDMNWLSFPWFQWIGLQEMYGKSPWTMFDMSLAFDGASWSGQMATWRNLWETARIQRWWREHFQRKAHHSWENPWFRFRQRFPNKANSLKVVRPASAPAWCNKSCRSLDESWSWHLKFWEDWPWMIVRGAGPLRSSIL